MNIAALVLVVALGQVKEHRDLAYFDGEGADAKKHKLDLYVPESKEPAPVLMWIHGGAWKAGDRSQFVELGRRFAESGIACAAISYRLVPDVKHPEQIRDCAKAFAWLRAHVKEYGGDPERLYVAGHSAGGHLAALLALNRKYLEELKVPEEALKGVIPMSGVYRIPAIAMDIPGMRMFKEAFGTDPEVCKEASPIEYVSKAKAPMLVITEADEEGGSSDAGASTKLIRLGTKGFQKALEEAGIKDVEFRDAAGRNHVTLVVKMMGKEEDPSRTLIVEFVRNGNGKK